MGRAPPPRPTAPRRVGVVKLCVGVGGGGGYYLPVRCCTKDAPDDGRRATLRTAGWPLRR